ncbi:PBECR2 nuclease fold domain-containing protein [Hungatella hathewayi]|uniref:PBECR2 nuclease fold domain-containing protein n=1 Tax=Hungatella hathewayi TaxID=154046 RepID=UPI00325BFA2B
MPPVYTVGKLNKNLFTCITDDIVTDEVIITENQMKHILERHPDSFEDAIQSLESAVTSPDYIFKDRNRNSALLIKKLPDSDEYVQIVLRLCTSEEEPDFKNSIISCWKISHKRLQNYLRNKTYLYKKE